MSGPDCKNGVSTSSSSKEPEMSYYEQIMRLVQASSDAISALAKPMAITKPAVSHVPPKNRITDSDFDDSDASTSSAHVQPRKKARTTSKEELNIEFGVPKHSTDKPPRQIQITDKAMCEYIRRCVYDFQHFGGTKHKELWRQLGVELGHRVFDVAKIGVPALEDADDVAEDKPSNTPPQIEPYFTPAQDAKIISYVAENVGNGVGIWEILGQEFRCATFFVMQRWCLVMPKIKQHQLITLGVNRRYSRELRQVGETSLTPFHDATTVFIAEQVKIYNNTYTNRTAKQFWRVITAYLNKHNLTSTTFTKTDDVYNRTDIQKCYEELCFTYPGSSTIVPCQPQCISNINAVVYIASENASLVMDSNLRGAVHKWWCRHLYHHIRDVYAAFNKYCAWQRTTIPPPDSILPAVTANTSTKTTQNHIDDGVNEVEYVLRTMLFVVVLSVTTDSLVESALPVSNTIPGAKSGHNTIEGSTPASISSITALRSALLPPVLLPLPLLLNANINLPPLRALTSETIPTVHPTELHTQHKPPSPSDELQRQIEPSVPTSHLSYSGAQRWAMLAEVCDKAPAVEVKKQSKARKNNTKIM